MPQLMLVIVGCIIIGLLYFARRGITAIGWILGLLLAGVAAFFAPQILKNVETPWIFWTLCLLISAAIIGISFGVSSLLSRHEKKRFAERFQLGEDVEEYLERDAPEDYADIDDIHDPDDIPKAPEYGSDMEDVLLDVFDFDSVYSMSIGDESVTGVIDAILPEDTRAFEIITPESIRRPAPPAPRAAIPKKMPEKMPEDAPEDIPKEAPEKIFEMPKKSLPPEDDADKFDDSDSVFSFAVETPFIVPEDADVSLDAAKEPELPMLTQDESTATESIKPHPEYLPDIEMEIEIETESPWQEIPQRIAREAEEEESSAFLEEALRALKTDEVVVESVQPRPASKPQEAPLKDTAKKPPKAEEAARKAPESPKPPIYRTKTGSIMPPDKKAEAFGRRMENALELCYYGLWDKAVDELKRLRGDAKTRGQEKQVDLTLLQALYKARRLPEATSYVFDVLEKNYSLTEAEKTRIETILADLSEHFD